MTALREPRDIAKLPDRTIFQSDLNCLWDRRHGGRRWVKRGGGVQAIDPDRLTGVFESVPIAYFKDPLPAKVVSYG
ncbi:hypothetical protein SEA_ERICMILLARD_138 [Mycobacterium phage EricMillard]|nr:hypothetical protein SEA_ERICMILLARD_138 [Mycobacterium phage EricMillard]